MVLVGIQAKGLALVVGVALVRRWLRTRGGSSVLQQLDVDSTIGQLAPVIPGDDTPAAIDVACLSCLPHFHVNLILVDFVQLAMVLAFRLRRRLVVVV